MCRYMESTIEDYCFCSAEGYRFDYQVNEYMCSKPKGKPDWCPIKEIPVRLEELKCPHSMSDYQRKEFSRGWNACLDEIERR